MELEGDGSTWAMKSDDVEMQTGLKRLRSSADNLTQCLRSLLNRIERMETEEMERLLGPERLTGVALPSSGGERIRVRSQRESTIRALLSPEVSQCDYLTVDPASGLRKQVIVTERVFASHSSRSAETSLIGRLPFSTYETRLLTVHPRLFAQVKMECRNGGILIVGVEPEVAAEGVHVGDILLEVNGEKITNPQKLLLPFYAGVTSVQLKLVPSHLFNGPMEFVRMLESHRANMPPSVEGVCGENGQRASPYLSFDIRSGDILQVLSQGPTYLQARKVNEISSSGYVPLSIRMERVALVSPYGRRLLLLLGAAGVGRRTLKAMLQRQLPNELTSVIAMTSRAPKPIEQEGRDYRFVTKEQMLRRIRNGGMLEWGEHNGHLYGTPMNAIREAVRSGRLCVVDCSPKAVGRLYNREFMPYVVLVAVPPYEEMVQIERRRKRIEANADANLEPLELQKLKETSDASEALLAGGYAHYFHQVLVFNRNREVMLRRLLESLERLKLEPQWIPREWMGTES